MLDSDIEDMDRLIGELSNAADSCRGILSSDVQTSIDDVVSEWVNFTKPSVEDLVSDHERLEELSNLTNGD